MAREKSVQNKFNIIYGLYRNEIILNVLSPKLLNTKTENLWILFIYELLIKNFDFVINLLSFYHKSMVLF
jgi:hypothetical protein